MQDYSIMWFGFNGQKNALTFNEGRFRLPGEDYDLYTTRRDIADVDEQDYGTRRVVVVPAPEPEPEIDHTDRMRQHLIGQFQWEVIDEKIYGDKPVLRALLTALGAEMDELNQAVNDLKNKRWIDTADGVQLDGIGEIVDRDRQIDEAIAIKVFGFYGQPNVAGFGQARFRGANESNLASYILEDTEYRLVLALKAMKNKSRATAEDAIQSLKYVFNAPTVALQETGNANIIVAIGRELTDNDMLLANAVDLIIRAGGVGLKYKSFFPGAYFGFLGQPNAAGFGQGAFARMF
jgi:hypothetical protein